jgi:phenylpyruvate tautomerase PptA (4-oxalocrotonate tautomerase family)
MPITTIQEMNDMDAEQCRQQIINTITQHKRAITDKPWEATPILGLSEVTALWEIAAQLAQMNAGRPKPEVTEHDVAFINRMVDEVSEGIKSRGGAAANIIARVSSIIASNK